MSRRNRPEGRRTMRPLMLGMAGLVLASTIATPGTYALWSSSATTTVADPRVARTTFETRLDGGAYVPLTNLTNSVNQKAVLTTTDAMDTRLIVDKQIAIPIEVRSLAQGNNGLRYTPSVAVPADDTLWGASNVKVFPVTSAANCTVAAAPASSNLAARTPIAATYSTGTTPVTDHWCVVASHKSLPGDGVFDAGASAEGYSVMDGSRATDTNTFGVLTKTQISATNLSPALTVTFDPEITRP